MIEPLPYKPEVLFGKAIRGDQIGDISRADQLILIPEICRGEVTYDYIGNRQRNNHKVKIFI